MLTTLAMFSTSHVRMASSVGGPEIGVTFLFFAIGPFVHLLCRLFVELRLLLLLGNFNSRSQTKLLHQADHGAGDIYLPPFQSVHGRTGKSMVVIVPRLPKGGNSEQRIVGAAVLKLIGTAAKNVANRIDTPGGVMNNQNPNQASPHKTAPHSQPASGDSAFGRCRQNQSQSDPQKIQTV